MHKSLPDIRTLNFSAALGVNFEVNESRRLLNTHPVSRGAIKFLPSHTRWHAGITTTRVRHSCAPLCAPCLHHYCHGSGDTVKVWGRAAQVLHCMGSGWMDGRRAWKSSGGALAANVLPRSGCEIR